MLLSLFTVMMVVLVVLKVTAFAPVKLLPGDCDLSSDTALRWNEARNNRRGRGRGYGKGSGTGTRAFWTGHRNRAASSSHRHGRGNL